MAGKFKPALVLLDKNRIVTLIKYSTFVLVAIVLATAVMRFSWESFEGLFSLEFVMSLGGILLGLNVFYYAFLLVRNQKRRAAERGNEDKSGNARLLTAGFLGGAIAAYAAIFIYRHKTDNALMMVLLPLLGALNLYLIYALIRSGFPFFI